MWSLVCELLTDESGVTAVEYGLIAALIAAFLILVMMATGLSLSMMWDRLAACLATPTAAGCV